jgi:hypothetical protein
MAYNGSGTFLINTAGQPVVSGTVISSTAFNALTADLATGLSTCITKDGQTTPTANIPMGSNKITGLANGTAATDAVNLSQVQATTAKLLGSVSGTDTITAAATPALAAYAAGQMFYFVAAGANTGAVTLNIDSLGAKSVTRDGSTALVAGDIASGEVVMVVYDGTRFQTIGPNTFNGTLPVANGGTGQTSYTNGQLLIGNTTGNTLTKATLTAGANITITNGAGSITIAGTSLPAMNIVSGTSQTAVASNHYVLTNAAATTVTLPASPTAGDVVWVTVGNGRTDNVIARNSSNINSIAENMTIDNAYAGIQLRYADATRGWVFT